MKINRHERTLWVTRAEDTVDQTVDFETRLAPLYGQPCNSKIASVRSSGREVRAEGANQGKRQIIEGEDKPTRDWAQNMTVFL